VISRRGMFSLAALPLALKVTRPASAETLGMAAWIPAPVRSPYFGIDRNLHGWVPVEPLASHEFIVASIAEMMEGWRRVQHELAAQYTEAHRG